MHGLVFHFSFVYNVLQRQYKLQKKKSFLNKKMTSQCQLFLYCYALSGPYVYYILILLILEM